MPDLMTAHLIPDVIEVLESLELRPGADFSFVDGSDWAELSNDHRVVRLALDDVDLHVYVLDRHRVQLGAMAFTHMPATVIAAAVHQLLQED